jgi:nucleotide-binding universal stress UspA family protein
MKILLATDGSEYSRIAAQKCCRFLAAEPGTVIKILSVVEPFVPLATEPFVTTHEYYTIVEEELKRKAGQAVAEAEAIIRNAFGEKAVIETAVLTGNVKQTIVDEAESFGATMIVIGSHGYGFLERVLLGSVSSFVVHHAHCSILIARPDDAAKGALKD